MTHDSQLLRQYVDDQDEAAFAELVRRHMDLVYSVALRQANGDTHLAQDATQAVFADLVRKAPTLTKRETLAGWLHTSARFAASNAIRSEQRRRARELESVLMHENTAIPDQHWELLRPLLDEMVGLLKETERDALVLRFFEGKSHQEIGVMLGLNENTANKRIERALEKLRGHFAHRGVTVSAVLLATSMASHSVQAAPVELAGKLSMTSLTGAGAALPAGFGPVATTAFFMYTKTKIILAAAALVILWFVWENKFSATPAGPSLPDASTPVASTVKAAVVKPAAPMAAASPVQVAAPVAPPAPAAQPVPANIIVPRPGSDATNSPTNPRAEVKTAMGDFVNLLQTGDYAKAIETYMQIPPKMTGQQLVDALSSNPDFPNTVQMLIDATTAAQTTSPVYDETGTLATYKLSQPTAGKTMVRWKKINDLWYVDAFE